MEHDFGSVLQLPEVKKVKINYSIYSRSICGEKQYQHGLCMRKLTSAGKTGEFALPVVFITKSLLPLCFRSKFQPGKVFQFAIV